MRDQFERDAIRAEVEVEAWKSAFRFAIKTYLDGKQAN
jgi:hypothetical protein